MNKINTSLSGLGWKTTGLVLSVLGSISVAGAQGSGAAVADVGPIPILDLTFKDMLGRIVNTLLYGAGIVAVIYLIWGGLSYVTAGGDSEKAAKGRTAITNAVIGIIIIAAALAIYNGVIGAVQSSSGQIS